jgi:hypothetical protein
MDARSNSRSRQEQGAPAVERRVLRIWHDLTVQPLVDGTQIHPETLRGFDDTDILAFGGSLSPLKVACAIRA